MEPAARLHRAGLAEPAGRRVIEVRGPAAGAALATVAHHEHAPVLEQRRRMASMGRAHRTGLAERPRDRVVELGGCQEGVDLGGPIRGEGDPTGRRRARARQTSDDEHAAVGQQGGRVLLAWSGHRAGRAERAGRRVVQLGRCPGPVRAGRRAVVATREQHASVVEQRGRLARSGPRTWSPSG